MTRGGGPPDLPGPDMRRNPADLEVCRHEVSTSLEGFGGAEPDAQSEGEADPLGQRNRQSLRGVASPTLCASGPAIRDRAAPDGVRRNAREVAAEPGRQRRASAGRRILSPTPR